MSGKLQLQAQPTIKFAILATVILVLGAILGLVLEYGFGEPWGYGFVHAVSFKREMTLPTLFNVLLLIFNGLLMFAIWRVRRSQPHRHIWFVLGVFICFLAYDEYAFFHETLAESLPEGYPELAFAVPYVLAALVAGCFFLPVFFSLDRKTQAWMITAALLYGVGAIDSLRLASIELGLPYEGLLREIVIILEELLEFSGLIALGYALFRVIRDLGGIQIDIEVQRR